MKVLFDRYTIYDFSDEAIVSEICRKVRTLRRSCCVTQQEFATRSGVSIASVKRIESGAMTDINVVTLIKIMRTCGVLRIASQNTKKHHYDKKSCRCGCAALGKRSSVNIADFVDFAEGFIDNPQEKIERVLASVSKFGMWCEKYNIGPDIRAKIQSALNFVRPR